MTTSQSLFPTNSHWAPQEVNNLVKQATPPKPSVIERTREKLRHTLEDWSLRVQPMADEAGDNHLLALESDLLDLRDEMVYVLHQLLLESSHAQAVHPRGNPRVR